jgi:hypothetical protein
MADVAAPQPDGGQEPAGEAPIPAGQLGHPKGTLAIVAVYGLLFALGWLAIYLLVFVPRGTPHP